ncbi:hypothetical protein [Leptospira licerasiae]|uniref:Uncharacterized protein n=1 Tax=Leptospira licerasiae str. MMD4847 TaxID=1049971 RepID=A0ABN0H9T3_9LEPT|nr:hypothetical protein [Leptospira licerasiae]EIE01460.1 hypothetical protein LEP1GSC185_3951 [Leptospira licerasiae serovar Varillal str. VAR 010]EJZ42334.1 hypothetical protein LEP1GSC178_0020 [Leptospira licerasiae str. MMD4847]
MNTPIKAVELLEINPESEKAQELRSSLQNSIVVTKNPWRHSNKTFFLGLAFTMYGFYLLRTFPDVSVSEGFGEIKLHAILTIFGLTLMSWFKLSEIIKVLGDFISKLRGVGQ